MIWFTSDTHFGHKGIIRMCDRPWSRTENMDRGLIANWNAVIAPGDTVYHLGDFMFSSGKRRAREIFSQLNGEKHFVIGNHDRKEVTGLPWASKPEMRKEVVLASGHKVLLQHKPPAISIDPDAIVLHGHVHKSADAANDLPVMDVGVDAHGWFPVSETFITAKAEQHLAGLNRLAQLMRRAG